MEENPSLISGFDQIGRIERLGNWYICLKLCEIIGL